MLRSRTRERGGIGGSGGGFANLLRYAEVQARGPSSRLNSGVTNAFYFNCPIAVAGDHEAFVVSFNNFYPASGTTLSGVGNSYTIQEAYLISPSNVAYPVKVSGSAVFSVANNTDEVKSDPIIIPSATDGEDWWLKGIGTMSVSGYIPTVNIVAADITNAQTAFYVQGSTTPSDPSASGPFTYSGSAPSAASVLFKPQVKGYPVSADHQAVIIFGDSMSDGDGDSTANGMYGRGQWQRATTNSTGQKRIAMANFAKSGSSFQLAVDNTQFDVHYPCATVAVNSYGTNNVDSNTLGQMQTYDDTLNAKFTAAGVATILRQELAMRTTSTDDWATLGNQTVLNANWGTAGKVKQFNDALASDVGVTITEVISYAPIREVTDYTKWPIPKLYNADVTHFNTLGAQTMGANNRLDLLNYATIDMSWFEGLYAWLDASDTATISATSGSVDTWADKSGNVRNATASGGARPITGTRTVNSLNGLDFDGSADYMDWALPTTLPNGANTYFMAVYNDVPTTQQFHLTGYVGGSPYWGFDTGSFGGIYARAFAGNGQVVQENSGPSSVGLHIYAYTRSGTSHTIYCDNGQSETATNATDNAMSGYYIGKQPVGSFTDGVMCEIPVFNRAFSAKEINLLVNKCLKTKWGGVWTNF